MFYSLPPVSPLKTDVRVSITTALETMPSSHLSGNWKVLADTCKDHGIRPSISGSISFQVFAFSLITRGGARFCRSSATGEIRIIPPRQFDSNSFVDAFTWRLHGITGRISGIIVLQVCPSANEFGVIQKSKIVSAAFQADFLMIK